MNDKILLFLMLGGLQLGSEGRIDELAGMVDDSIVLWLATHPESGERFFINLTNVLAVQEVDRVSVSAAPRKIIMPKDN